MPSTLNPADNSIASVSVCNVDRLAVEALSATSDCKFVMLTSAVSKSVWVESNCVSSLLNASFVDVAASI